MKILIPQQNHQKHSVASPLLCAVLLPLLVLLVCVCVCVYVRVFTHPTQSHLHTHPSAPPWSDDLTCLSFSLYAFSNSPSHKKCVELDVCVCVSLYVCAVLGTTLTAHTTTEDAHTHITYTLQKNRLLLLSSYFPNVP